ncbi:MAG: hypothetical protein PXX73_02050 [Sideroxydans sp.]|nr:hypothetical protein [Sideroxydans sp.]
MAELFLIGMIVTLVVLTIRSARPVILDRPVIIARAGKYHITLAPQLNRAQTFIEQIVLALGVVTRLDSEIQMFAVQDEKLCPTGEKSYLLAVTLRGGVAYFQAIMPNAALQNDHAQAMREFAAAVLHDIPASVTDASTQPLIARALHAAAQHANLRVMPLGTAATEGEK